MLGTVAYLTRVYPQYHHLDPEPHLTTRTSWSYFFLEEAADFHLKIKKFFFLRNEVEYLGLLIRLVTIAVYKDYKATREIREAAFNKTTTQMKSLLVASNAYHWFIKDYAKVATPVNEM